MRVRRKTVDGGIIKYKGHFCPRCVSAVTQCNACYKDLNKNEIIEHSHVIPKSKDGADKEDNIGHAHRDCNRRVGSRDLRDWNVDKKGGQPCPKGILRKFGDMFRGGPPR